MSDFQRMPMVYIAGPFRGANAWEVEQNIRRAEERAFRVAQLGFGFICPHMNTRFFDGTLTDEFWLSMTAEMMRRCDCIYPDLSKPSSGTEGERNLMRELGRPEFLDEVSLVKWCKLWEPAQPQPDVARCAAQEADQ